MAARPGRPLAALLAATAGALLAARCAGTVLTPCEKALDEAINGGGDALGRLALATGKSPPFDAGKYEVCIAEAQNEYYLLKLVANRTHGENSATTVPMELGLCAPAACAAGELEALVNSGAVRSLLPALTGFSIVSATASAPRQEVQRPGVGACLALLGVGLLASVACAASCCPAAARSSAVAPAGGGPAPAAAAGAQQSPASRRTDGAAHRDTAVQLLPSLSEDTLPADQLRPVTAAAFEGPSTVGPSRLAALAKAFSATGDGGTLAKLMETPPCKPTDCLNGVRVLSMFWIILGHTFLMPISIAGYSNMEEIIDTGLTKNAAEDNVFMFVVLSGQSGVDTFFFLSAFLLSMLTLKDLRSRNGRINVFLAVVMRYVRLTPSLALTMLVYTGIWPYLGTGPFAARYQDSIFRRCAGPWWSEFTYTMNFIPFNSDNVCMGWTWYLGDDMIFFILSLPMVVLYHRSKLLGWGCAIVLTVASLGITAWLIVQHHLSVYLFDHHMNDYFYWSYSKPYCRLPAFMVGIATAWVLDELEQRGVTRGELPSGRRGAGGLWATAAAALAAGLLLFMVFIPVTDFGAKKNTWGDLASVLYLDFGRMLWAVCWAVITLLCYYGHLPAVNGFLSHRMWTPLARLTYGAYLLHPLVIKLAAGRALHYYTFSGMDMFYRHLGNVVCAYGGAVVLWALVERPTMTFTSAMVKKGPPRRNGSGAAAGPQQPAEAGCAAAAVSEAGGKVATEVRGSRGGDRTPDRAAGPPSSGP